MPCVCRYFCPLVGNFQCCYDCPKRNGCKKYADLKPCYDDLISELDYQQECVHYIPIRKEN